MGRFSQRSGNRQRPQKAETNTQAMTQSTPTNIDTAQSLPAPSTFTQLRKKRGLGKMLNIPDIKPSGESGRSGFHPLHFFRIILRSSCTASAICNILWPVVPAALVVTDVRKDDTITIFVLAYIAMVPCANLVGFAGEELARKLPYVAGILVEITCGSVVEILLFMILLKENQTHVIKAAILGSILATMLLCLGFCFFVGGLFREEQSFNDAISEAGSGLLLTAGVGLAVPTVFRLGLESSGLDTQINDVDDRVQSISRIISVLLIISYAIFIIFQTRTHHGIYNAVFEEDEQRRPERDDNLHSEAKLTMTECIIALAVSITLVTLMALTLVLQIEPILKMSHVTDSFMGLILVPLVEKFAEHLTAINEAWDDRMNFAMSHVLGSTLQTALFNAPLTVIVGWTMHKDLDLDFDIFNLVMLMFSILTVGRLLQDQKSNYLEGSLLVILYVAVAVTAYHTPNPVHAGKGEHKHPRGL